PEDGYEEDGHDERGDRRADGRDEHAQVVDDRVLLQRADNPERDREGEREGERGEAELKGRSDALADDLHDRSLPGEAQPQVTPEQIAHVDDELLRDRLVDAVVAIDPVQGLLRQGPVRVAIEGAARRRVSVWE